MGCLYIYINQNIALSPMLFEGKIKEQYVQKVPELAYLEKQYKKKISEAGCKFSMFSVSGAYLYYYSERNIDKEHISMLTNCISQIV